ncbi:MAG: translation initiation factor eIF3 subunit g [Candelaria pacifica]|nr:MAG: translation initiation factor eIF3 subunit g [Candelaria pacifica]
MSKDLSRRDWADEEEFDDPTVLPPQQITSNKDGTKTIVSFRFNDDGKKVKTTRKIKTTIIKERVNSRVAERKAWPKFGLEKGKASGPSFDTTSIGENIMFRPSINWKANAKEEKPDQQSLKAQLANKTVKCRICSGDHFTSKCPYKDTMAPVGEASGAADMDGMGGADGEPAAGGLGQGGSSYVPPHLRNKGAGASTGDRMGGKYERDDLATLRVTNVSELAEEQDLRDMFERFGRVTRVFLAKDRETGMAKGFAFISFQERTDAAKACEKMDGYGFKHLILRVEQINNNTSQGFRHVSSSNTSTATRVKTPDFTPRTPTATMCIIELHHFSECGHAIPTSRAPCPRKPAGVAEEHCVVISYHYDPVDPVDDDTGVCSSCLAAKLQKEREEAERKERGRKFVVGRANAAMEYAERNRAERTRK